MYGSNLGRRVESLQVNQPSREHPHRDQANATDVDANGNTRMREQGKFETPRHKTVINRNGQITPADEWDGGYNVLKDEEELSLVEMDTIQSSMSAPAGNFLKRKASRDLTTNTPVKTGKIRELNMSVEWAVPSLFNGAQVAQVRPTDEGMRHEAMAQYELDAYKKWTTKYRVLDDRGEAKEFRYTHIRWKKRCGVCFFSRRGGAKMWMPSDHSVNKCPQKGSAIWKSAMQRADVIQEKVLTKRVVRGEALGWPISSGCWKCGLPAWRCDSFENIPGRFFHHRVPEVACQDKDLLRHIAGSVLAHFEAGAACVVAQVKESWGQEKTTLESQYGIEWLQDYGGWTSPECSYFALVVFELEKFGTIARSI